MMTDNLSTLTPANSLGGLVSLPPSDGHDTTAPFVFGTNTSAAISGGLTVSGPDGLSVNLGGGGGGAGGGGTSTNMLGVPNDPTWYVTLAQYAGLALLAVGLVLIGGYVLVKD